MDVATALLRIKRQFGDEYGVVITNDDIYGWMHDAELDIIRSAGSNDSTITVAANAFPSSIPDSVNIRRVSIAGVAVVPTSKEELDLLAISEEAKGGANYWYKYNKQVFLWPINTADTRQVKVTYSKSPTLMTGLPAANSLTVPEVYHEDVIKYCIAKAHNKNNNAQAEKAQMDLYDRNVGIRRDESYSIDAPIYKIGDPMDFD